jgi:hypothetical protein
VKKGQNKVGEYREMFLAWKKHPVVITAGYIIGFPNDTPESILHDIDVIKRELPIDLIYFTNLTPLPGSEDHQTLTRKGIWMDPDLNKYDLNHRVTHHQKMSDAEWDKAYDDVWDRFYTFEHMETILKRMTALGSNKKLTTVYRLLWYRDFRRLHHCHPLEGGFFRVRVRTDRRFGMPRENPLVFYPKFALTEARNFAAMAWDYVKLRRIMKRVWTDPGRMEYRDIAITPAGAAEKDLALYSETRGTTAALEKQKRQQEIIAAAKAKSAQAPVPNVAAE